MNTVSSDLGEVSVITSLLLCIRVLHLMIMLSGGYGRLLVCDLYKKVGKGRSPLPY